MPFAEPELVAGLSARWNRDTCPTSVNRGYFDMSAQGRCGEGQRNFTKDVSTVPLEDVVRRN